MVKQPTLNEQVKDVRFTCIVKIIPIVHNYPNLDRYNKKNYLYMMRQNEEVQRMLMIEFSK